MHDAFNAKTFATISVVFAVEDRHRLTVLEKLKPFAGLRLAYGIITKCFFKHSVCFRIRLAEYEAEF
jgi:hypothetical protein